MSYGNGISALYRFPAAAIASAGVFGRIKGPAGAEGRLISVSSVISTTTTVAASVVSVGNSGDPNAYADHTVPVAAANTGQNAFTRGVDTRIDADDDVEVSSDGGSTAGAADVLVLIEWYGGDAS
jgi:hypothetical protein